MKPPTEKGWYWLVYCQSTTKTPIVAYWNGSDFYSHPSVAAATIPLHEVLWWAGPLTPPTVPEEFLRGK